MQDGIGNGGCIGFVGFQYEKEAFVVGCSKGGEGGNFLKGLVVFDVCEFERSD